MTTETVEAETAKAVMRRLVASGRIYATTSETATILHYDRRTVLDGIAAGQIPAIRIMTSHRVPVSWIMAQPGIPDGSGADGKAA